MKERLKIGATIGTLLWLPFFGLEEVLLKSGVLNTKDLAPFVGPETGTVWDYALNIWHWDAFGFLLAACALPSLALLGFLLPKSRREGRPQLPNATL